MTLLPKSAPGTLVESLIEALRPYPFRGKMRLLTALIPHRGERSVRVFGYCMRLDLGEEIQRHIYFGTFEPKETALVRRWLRPGMTVVDVGANVGYYTLLAASRVGPTGRVFALEPSPDAYQRLAETVQANHLGQVRTLPYGLSDRPGEVMLYLPPASSHNHTPTMVPHPEGRPIKVPVRTLDDCLAEWNVDTVDLLKLDVEGHEPRILQGAAGALTAGHVRAVLCEFNDTWLRLAGTSSQALYDMLIAVGFADLHGQPRFIPDGLLNRFLWRQANRIS